MSTKEGLESARKRGRVDGRKAGLTEAAKTVANNAAALYKSNMLTTAEMCGALKISKATLYKSI